MAWKSLGGYECGSLIIAGSEQLQNTHETQIATVEVASSWPQMGMALTASFQGLGLNTASTSAVTPGGGFSTGLLPFQRPIPRTRACQRRAQQERDHVEQPSKHRRQYGVNLWWQI